MNHLKLCVIIEKTNRQELEVLVLGHKLNEYAQKNLKNFTVLTCETNNAPKEIGSFDYAVLIKDSMPLVQEATIYQAIERMEGCNLASIKFGAGCIVQAKIYGQELTSKTIFESPEVLDVSSLELISVAFKHIARRNVYRAIQNGATVLDIENTYIGDEVTVKKGARLYPNITILGNSEVGENSNIESACYLQNAIIGNNTTIIASRIEDSQVGNGTRVGPYSYLRNHTIVKDNCRIGDFVELKNAVFENGVKAAHLAYVGDADIGEETNVGCGTVFVNYNGVIKQHTSVGKNVFIGSNSNLIAPIKVGNNAYIAAGSTVTNDVPDDVLCVARERQVIKENWKRPIKNI